VILAMIVLISTSLNTTPGANDQQGGKNPVVTVDPNASPTPTPTPTPTPAPTPNITGVSLKYAGSDITEFTEAIGRETPLKLEVYPLNVPMTNSDVVWTSDNENVCTVKGDNTGCVITNTGTGKAVVTVTVFGKSDSVTVYGRESW